MLLAPLWTISVDPLTFAIGFAHVQVERSLGPRASLYVGPSLRLFDGILADTNGPYMGLGIESGVRGFFSGTAPEGGWVMWRGVVARVATTTPPVTATFGAYTSVLAGYTGIFDSNVSNGGLVLSGGVGVSYFDYGVQTYGVHGFAPAAHTNVGWAF